MRIRGRRTLAVAALGGVFAGACVPGWMMTSGGGTTGDGSTASNGSSGKGSAIASTGAGGIGGSTASNGWGGTGGMTASNGSGGTGGMTASNGSGGTGGMTASNGSGGSCDATACDGGNTEAGCALVIVEVAVQPMDAEYVAIYNPCDASVNLTNYYLADFNTYYQVVSQVPPDPQGGTDFVARFPDAASIGPGHKQYVSIKGAGCFKDSCPDPDAGDPKFKGYGFYPHYELVDSGSVDAGVLGMVSPFTGAVGDAATLTNNGEPVILFLWDGASSLVTDVDYVYYRDYGIDPGTYNPVVDKTCVMVGGERYRPDMAIDASNAAPLLINWHDSGVHVTCRRPYVNTGEGTCGNGIFGSDQTSERWSDTWWACPDSDGG